MKKTGSPMYSQSAHRRTQAGGSQAGYGVVGALAGR